jgi:hypothetical protein
MSGPYQHIRMFAEDMGVDLRSGEVNRPYPFATASQNTMPSPQGGFQTRYGTHIKTSVYGKFGITRFDTTNMFGVSKTEIIGFGADTVANSIFPYRLVAGSFTITNDHATLPATVTMFYDEASTQFRLKLTVDGTTEVDQALGLGTEGSPYMLSSLETVVDAASNFSMSTPTNASTTPAAFMELLNETVVALASTTVTYYYWEVIPTFNVAASGWAGNASLKNNAIEFGDEIFRNISTAIVNNVLYIAPRSGPSSVVVYASGTSSSISNLCKYDGQSFYRAGLPPFTQSLDAAETSGGTILDNYKGNITRTNFSVGENYYFATLKQIDKAGNIIEGDRFRAAEAPITPAVGTSVIIVSNLAVALSSGGLESAGFNARSARVNGDQTSTTITVTAATHTLQAGDVAYFWHNGQARFVAREILSRTTTTVTVSTQSLDTNSASLNYDTGSTPQVKSGAIISANLRLCLWRTKKQQLEPYYLVEELPYADVSGDYIDDKPDTLLGAEYIEPAYAPGLPPPAKFVASFGNQLLISGDSANPSTVYFSDESPESFPAGTHSFDVTGTVTGVHQCGSVLAVATNETLDIVEGDLLNFNFRVDRVSRSIGCTSHQSMIELEEGLLAFQSAKGPYRMINGRDIAPLGTAPNSRGIPVSRLEPFFTQFYNDTEEKPVFRRAVAGIVRSLNLYCLFVPFELPTKPGFATSNSVLWVYDYSRDSWRKWTGINAAGGIADMDNVLYFASRAHDGAAGAAFANVVTRFSQQQVVKGIYNYADHGNYIDVKHQYHWECFGEPSISKKFIALSLLSTESRLASSFAVTVKTYLNYDTTLISTSDTVTFSASTVKSMELKLKAEKADSMLVSLESQAYYAPMQISGTEIEAVLPYRPKMNESA